MDKTKKLTQVRNIYATYNNRLYTVFLENKYIRFLHEKPKCMIFTLIVKQCSTE